MLCLTIGECNNVILLVNILNHKLEHRIFRVGFFYGSQFKITYTILDCQIHILFACYGFVHFAYELDRIDRRSIFFIQQFGHIIDRRVNSLEFQSCSAGSHQIVFILVRDNAYIQTCSDRLMQLFARICLKTDIGKFEVVLVICTHRIRNDNRYASVTYIYFRTLRQLVFVRARTFIEVHVRTGYISKLKARAIRTFCLMDIIVLVRCDSQEYTSFKIFLFRNHILAIQRSRIFFSEVDTLRNPHIGLSACTGSRLSPSNITNHSKSFQLLIFQDIVHPFESITGRKAQFETFTSFYVVQCFRTCFRNGKYIFFVLAEEDLVVGNTPQGHVAATQGQCITI